MSVSQVNKQQIEMDTKFGVLHRAMLILDKFQHPISATIRSQFNSAPQRYVISIICYTMG